MQASGTQRLISMVGYLPRLLTIRLMPELPRFLPHLDFSGRLALAIFCKMSLDHDTDLLTSDPDGMALPHPMIEAVSSLSSISSG